MEVEMEMERSWR